MHPLGIAHTPDGKYLITNNDDERQTNFPSCNHVNLFLTSRAACLPSKSRVLADELRRGLSGQIAPTSSEFQTLETNLQSSAISLQPIGGLGNSLYPAAMRGQKVDPNFAFGGRKSCPCRR